MTDLIPLAIAAAIVLAVVVFVRLRVRKARHNTAARLAASRGRPGADKH